MHRDDPFSLRYMNWLGHHEFGANLKPFDLGTGCMPSSPAELEDFSYWVRYWACVYTYVLEHHTEQVVLFDYDRLCREPAVYLQKLAPVLELEQAQLEPFFSQIKSSTHHEHPPVEAAILAQAQELHQELGHRVATT